MPSGRRHVLMGTNNEGKKVPLRNAEGARIPRNVNDYIKALEADQLALEKKLSEAIGFGKKRDILAHLRAVKKNLGEAVKTGKIPERNRRDPAERRNAAMWDDFMRNEPMAQVFLDEMRDKDPERY